MTIQSFLRHVFTFFATAGTLLAGYNILSEGDAATVNEAGAKLVEPLTLFAAALVLALWRWVAARLGALFGAGAGEWTDKLGLIALGMIFGVMTCGLVSCGQMPAGLSGTPIKACVLTDAGTVCYSSKGGLSAEVDARSGK